MTEESFPALSNSEIPDSTQGLINHKKKQKNEAGAFHLMGIKENVLKAIKKMGYRQPTPIQRKSIPVVLAGKDAVLMARTGSGKTAAFVVPMIQKLSSHSRTVGARALVIATTRELIKQTHEFVRDIGKYSDLRTVEMVGGESMDANFEALARNPDIIIATPGRLLHMIKETGLSLKAVEYLVFDEADRLFEMGFKEQIMDIINRLPVTRQTLLVSATMPSMLADFVKVGLENPELIRLDVESKLSENLKLAYFTLRREDKLAALIYVMRELIRQDEQTIIFACTRHHCELICELFAQFSIEAVHIYGSMDQSARNYNLTRFKKREVKTLVVTDIAARGIDIPSLDNVINFDFPPKPKIFIHRVGRAARAGRSGTAFSFITLEEIPYLVELHMFLGRRMINKTTEDMKAEEEKIANQYEKHKNKRTPLNFYDGFFGSVPQVLLDTELEEIKRIFKNNAEVAAMERVCSRAYKLYVQTRGTPAPEYIRKAKQLEYDVHPLFNTIVPREQIETMLAQEGLLDRIGSYRPRQTVFEMGSQNTEQSRIMGKRRTVKSIKEEFKAKRKSSTSDSDEDDDQSVPDEERSPRDDEGLSRNDEMLSGNDEQEEHLRTNSEKKTLANVLLSKQHQKKRFLAVPNSVEQKSFKDEKFYISYERDKNRTQSELEDSYLKVDEEASAYRNQLKDISVDFMSENREDLAKSKKTNVWDRKKKKYVRVSPQEAVAMRSNKKIRNESGSYISEGDKNKSSKQYQLWKKKTKIRIQQVGETEDPGIFSSKRQKEEEMRAREEEGNGAPSGGKKRTRGTKRKMEDETLSIEQIRKKKREQEKKEKTIQTRQMFKKYGRQSVMDQLQLDGMHKAMEKRQQEKGGRKQKQPGVLKKEARAKTRRKK